MEAGYRKIIFAWHVRELWCYYLSMMIAFSVASETRNLKHAYAMRAVIYFISIWTLFAVAQAQAEEEVDQSNPYGADQSIASESREEAERRKHLKNIESLQENCEFKSEATCRCSQFQFEQIDEIAFFELQTQVHIAADGKTYELGEDQRDQRIETLIVTNSTFVNFPLHLFYAMPQLSELDMRRCRVQNVSWESFLAANKLQILLLSDNEISELSENLFNYAPELEYLFVSGNRLHTLHPNAFKGLRKLRHLDLSANQLQQLPERLFADLIGLQELFLAENQLSFISVDLLTYNTRLQTVSLHTNRLRQLDEYAFRAAAHMLLLDLSHNPELQVLILGLDAGHFIARNCSLTRVNLFGAVSNVDLDDNQLQELYFSVPEALQHLGLRNNSLVQLATLSHVPRLRHLNVADNPQLGDLPEDWQTPQLERLDLSNTGLDQLPLAALRGMPELRKLNVSANNISEIDQQAFDQLVNLTHFYIHANNWNCFNLRLVMDLLVLQHGMSYSIDKFDENFPGIYINGIACMYRLPESEQDPVEMRVQADNTATVIEYAQLSEPSEVEKLRQELKAVTQHFEARLDQVNGLINRLTEKIDAIERINSTLWNQVSIMV